MKTFGAGSGRDDGFSLVEVLVASFLLVIGFLALSRLVIGMMMAADLSRRTMGASSIAQGKMEDLLAGGFDAASSGSEGVDLDDVANYYTVAWTSTVSSVASIKDVSVATKWTDHRGKQHQVELESMLTEERSGMGGMSFTNIPIFAP